MSKDGDPITSSVRHLI